MMMMMMMMMMVFKYDEEHEKLETLRTSPSGVWVGKIILHKPIVVTIPSKEEKP